MRPHFRFAAALVSLALLVGAGAADFSIGSTSVYVVQPGDSLWAISRQAGISVDQLASANDMNPNDILEIGRQLTIPSPNTSPSSPDASASAFCSTFVADPGPHGVLPQLLSDSPDRLSLQPIFSTWASTYDLYLPLLEAVDWQESGWQQGVTSPTGAVGVGQIEPATAEFITTDLVDRPLDIDSTSDNIEMSASLLGYLAGQEGDNQCLTIAAYYEGAVNLEQYGVFSDTAAYIASVEALLPRFE